MAGIQMHEINSFFAQPLLDQLRTSGLLREKIKFRHLAGPRAASERCNAIRHPQRVQRLRHLSARRHQRTYLYAKLLQGREQGQCGAIHTVGKVRVVEEVKNLHFYSCATFSTRAVMACAGRATELSTMPVCVDSLMAFK